MVSGDIIFDESFRSTLSTAWHQYKSSQSLRPADDYILNVTNIVESTGTIQDLMQPVEEGNSKMKVTMKTMKVMMKMMKRMKRKNHHHKLSMNLLANPFEYFMCSDTCVTTLDMA